MYATYIYIPGCDHVATVQSNSPTQNPALALPSPCRARISIYIYVIYIYFYTLYMYIYIDMYFFISL